MTPAEIQREKAYRHAEALALGRTPERAQAEVETWEKLPDEPEEAKPNQPLDTQGVKG